MLQTKWVTLALLSFGCASGGAAQQPSSGAQDQEAVKNLYAGCARGLREPNEAQYANRMVESGVSAEEARAEASFVFSKVDPAFATGCGCFFEKMGGEAQLLQRLGGQAAEVDQWVSAELAKVSPEQAQDCVNKMTEQFSAHMPTKEEVAAFREDRRARSGK